MGAAVLAAPIAEERNVGARVRTLKMVKTMKHEDFSINSDYPLAHLPADVRAPIIAVHDHAQVAVEVAAQVVLSTISMATQHISDVKLPRIGVQKPLSSYFLSLAESGAGKTTAEDLAMQALYAHIEENEARHEGEGRNYRLDLKAYHSAVKEAEKAARGLSREQIAAALKDLGAPPVPPLRPDAITRMASYRGLLDLLRDGQPSVGLINDDSSGFIKGALNDPEMVTLLTDIWSGTTYRRTVGREILRLKGRRLSAHLMVQPNHADKLLHGEHTAEQGIIPRFNIAIAPTIMKAAAKGDVAAHEQTIKQFSERITALLAHPGSVANRNEVVVEHPLTMDADAEELFLGFMDEMAASSLPDGALAAIRSSAIRAPENAARLAGSMALFCRGAEAATIELPEISAAIALMYYYNDQKLALYGTTYIDPVLDMSDKVWAWISNLWDEPLISRRDLCRNATPKAARRADKAQAVIDHLERKGRLRRLTGRHMIKGEPHDVVWQIER